MKTYFNNPLRILVVTLAMLAGVESFAQQSIAGKVVDAGGEPVPGAAVMVEGTNNGVVSDLDGNFTIKAGNGAGAIVSIIGYKDKKVSLAPGMIVVLDEDTTLLEEVVVVGYGTAKKETLSGAISVVGEKSLENKGSLSSPLQALQGQVPGVFITRGSSAPGDESWSMNIRGSYSVNKADPLIIIDGVAYESVNELRLLNPSDIQSMSFLKDGAASIYGSRAAGGVVLITTKKGDKGRAHVDYNASFTLKTVGLMPELMSIDQWADAVLTTLENDGNANSSNVWYCYANLAKQYKGKYIDLADNPNPITGGFNDVADYVFNDSVDWLDGLFGNSYSTSHDMSVYGGSEKSTYRLSLGYMYDGSPLRYGNNNNKRYNIRLNNSFKLTDWLSVDSVISYQRQDQVAPTEVSAMLTVSLPMPGLPFTAIDGKPYAWGTWRSPASIAEYGGDNTLQVSSINISETAKARITDWLDFNANVGYSTSTAFRNTVKNSVEYYNYTGTTAVLTNPTVAQSSMSQTGSRTDFYSVSAYLNAHNTFGAAHHANVTLGGQYEFKEYNYFGVKATEIQDGLEVINGTGEITLVTPDKYQYAMASLFGRANYDYAERYLLEVNARYDGSSKFLAENRWKFFWGGSAAWRISKEPWMKDVDWLSELKLRASYGEVGNQNGISNYDGMQLYNVNSASGALIGSSLASYIATTGSLASTSRTWETIKNYNLGLDFGLLENRLSGTVEGFIKKNDNMLVAIEFPSILGDSAPKVNNGKFKAWGFEGQLQWRDRIGKDFHYWAGGTFTFARNELVDFGGSATITNGYVSNREGYPLNSLFGLRYAGKIQTEEQRQAYIDKYYPNNGIGMPNNLRLGDNMFEDANGDGKLDENDYVYLGSDTPEIQYSFNLGFEWKGFDFAIVFQGAANRTVWNGINQWTVPMRALYLNSTTQSIGNVWSESNPDGYYPTYTQANGNINTYNYQASSWSASNGAYLRLKNLTIGYSLPDKLFSDKGFFSGCRFYFTGTDLWEASHMLDGWDPEAKSSPSSTSRYPFLRGFVFGANIKF